MTLEDMAYIETQQQLMVIGDISRNIDIKSFLDRISHAHAVGPIADPTMYRQAIDNMRAIEKLARAVVNVQYAHDELMKTVKETHRRNLENDPSKN